MIEKYYAAHIKTSLDAAAINVISDQEKQERQESQPDQPSPQPAIEETEISDVATSTTSV
jgi:hypothetical protein